MKFDSFAHKGFFYELMTSRDERIFDKAFERREITLPPESEDEAKRIKAGVIRPRTRIVVNHWARKWVKDVISMFADQMHIPYGLAAQMIKTGDSDALVRHYTKRWLTLYKDHKHPDYEFIRRMLNPKDEISHYDEATGEPVKKKVPAIDQGPTNYMRDRWSWCLTLSVPNEA